AGTSPAPPPVGQVRLRWENPQTYVDLRGPSACELITEGERDELRARLGADPLRADADPARAGERISRSRAPIGQLLLDQSVVAGVGVAYRAEALFRLGVHPWRPGRELGSAGWQALWGDLSELMRDGVRAGRIDTVRPEHTPEAMHRPPRQDRHGGEVYVYRRAGQPCLVCGEVVRRGELAARNLYWCPRCQPPA
ncbi:MAG: Fpg/Nei family DNA glycosylase, partial [Micromonosporaceae bacterium]